MKKILTNLFLFLGMIFWFWKNTGFEAHHFQSSSQILIYGIWVVLALYLAFQVIVDILKILKR